MVNTSDMPSPRRSRRSRMAIAGICLGFMPFLVAEAALRILESGSNVDDVHDGFGTAPLFVRDEDRDVWATNLARQRFFFPQEFPADKPENEFRIFVLGGSTVQGRPFEPATSFSRWMELELNAIDPTRKYRVVNCGGISYASYRLTSVTAEILEHSPDAVVLATGHNEFLEDQTYSALKERSSLRLAVERAAEYSRLVMTLREAIGGAAPEEPESDQPPTDVEARLDDEAGYAAYHRDERWRSEIVNQFRDSVTNILENCGDAGVSVITVKLGANLRDCPPFKSEHRADLTAEEQQLWQRHFDEASAIESKEPDKALEKYRAAESIDDRYALLHFRIARCLDRLMHEGKEPAPAEKIKLTNEAYQRALDEDVCPLRIISETEGALVDLCARHNVPLVDAAAAVAARSPDGIPGFDAYIDHVHPSISAQQIIGQALTQAFVETNLVQPTKRLDASAYRVLYRQHLAELPRQYASNGRRRIGWLENWARRKRLANEVTPVDGRGYVALVQRRVDLADFNTASDDILMAVAMDDSAGEQLVRYAANLFGQGRTSDADWMLSQLNIPGMDETLDESIQLASVIVALETGSDEELSETLGRRDDWLKVYEADRTGWKEHLPRAQFAKAVN